MGGLQVLANQGPISNLRRDMSTESFQPKANTRQDSKGGVIQVQDET